MGLRWIMVTLERPALTISCATSWAGDVSLVASLVGACALACVCGANDYALEAFPLRGIFVFRCVQDPPFV